MKLVILICIGPIVYLYTYKHNTNDLQTISNWMLAVGVLLLVVIDLIILITYTAVEGARGNLSALRVLNRENPEDVSGVYFFSSS